MPKIHWKQGVNGAFEIASNWSTNTVPGPNDDVTIDAAGTYTVTVSTNRTILSLTTVSTATLAVTGGKFTITHGTGIGTSAGTISVANGAALALGGPFDNSGKIELNSIGRNTDLIIAGNVSLTGGGEITLSNAPDLGPAVHAGIVGNPPPFPSFLSFLFNFLPFLPVATLTNTDNTIDGAGVIGPNLRLVNAGNIIGNSPLAPLTLNTGIRTSFNSGLIEGTTDQGLMIFGNLANSGTLEASGEGARLVIDGIVTNSGAGANITASGGGAHVDLARATITGGAVGIGESGVVQSRVGSGSSVISGAALTGTGILQANTVSTLSVANSSIDTGIALMSNGNDSLLSVDGTVGANAGTIAGGEIEFKGPSAASITFAQGQVGSLKLGPAFTGTVSGFAGNQPVTFTNFFAFGDSTIDTGALQYLSTFLPSPPNPGLTHRLNNALANGGTDSPVGVGSMNTQLLAADFGLSANTAYTTGGIIGGGGTNYAISGALDAADPGSGADPGNGSFSNINQVGHTTSPDPHILSTVDQMQAYLNSVGGQADASALYLISSGGNDVSYALNTFIGDPYTQHAYLSAQAQSLASEIELLYQHGAQHIIVNNSMSDDPPGQLLFAAAFCRSR